MSVLLCPNLILHKQQDEKLTFDSYDEMLKEMVEYTKTIKVGDQDSGSLLGPIQNSMQYEKVKNMYQDAKDKGYKFAVGSPDFKETNKGFFAMPSIIDNPPNDSRIIQEEPFGPVSPI